MVGCDAKDEAQNLVVLFLFRSYTGTKQLSKKEGSYFEKICYRCIALAIAVYYKN